MLIENSLKMQKSLKTDISEAITPPPVIRFHEDRPCHALQIAIKIDLLSSIIILSIQDNSRKCKNR